MGCAGNLENRSVNKDGRAEPALYSRHYYCSAREAGRPIAASLQRCSNSPQTHFILLCIHLNIQDPVSSVLNLHDLHCYYKYSLNFSPLLHHSSGSARSCLFFSIPFWCWCVILYRAHTSGNGDVNEWWKRECHCGVDRKWRYKRKRGKRTLSGAIQCMWDTGAVPFSHRTVSDYTDCRWFCPVASLETGGECSTDVISSHSCLPPYICTDWPGKYICTQPRCSPNRGHSSQSGDPTPAYTCVCEGQQDCKGEH